MIRRKIRRKKNKFSVKFPYQIHWKLDLNGERQHRTSWHSLFTDLHNWLTNQVLILALFISLELILLLLCNLITQNPPFWFIRVAFLFQEIQELSTFIHCKKKVEPFLYREASCGEIQVPLHPTTIKRDTNYAFLPKIFLGTVVGLFIS